MKRELLKRIAATTCVASIILAGCEASDGGICLRWTIGFISLAVLSGVVFNRLERRGK